MKKEIRKDFLHPKGLPAPAYWKQSTGLFPGRSLSSFPIPKGLPARSTGAYRPVLTENAPLERFQGARCPHSPFPIPHSPLF